MSADSDPNEDKHKHKQDGVRDRRYNGENHKRDDL